MKKIILLLIIPYIMACEKEINPISSHRGTVTFYTGATGDGAWELIVDDIDRGVALYSPVPPPCEYPGFITLTLTVGIHTYDMKSNIGLAWGSYKEVEVTEGCQTFKAHL